MARYKPFCPQGHDKSEFGVAANGQCRRCRREQQTTEAYKARRRERQSTPQALHRRSRYDRLVRFPKAFARRINAALVRLGLA